jgi:hypothetical protein
LRELTDEEWSRVSGGFEDSGSEAQEIVVTGYRVNRYQSSGGYNYYYTSTASSGTWSTYYGAGSSADYADAASIDIDVKVPMTDQVKADVAELRDSIAKTTEKINALSDTAKVIMPDNKVITGAELKALWARVDFVITGDNYGENRAGKVDVVNGNATFHVNASHLHNYAGWDGGTDFYVLHELAHATDAGVKHSGAQWDAYRAATDDSLESAEHYAKSDWFKAGEAYANTLAKALAQLSGLPMGAYFDAPPHLYMAATPTVSGGTTSTGTGGTGTGDTGGTGTGGGGTGTGGGGGPPYTLEPMVE